jgi:hypothetical protein
MWRALQPGRPFDRSCDKGYNWGCATWRCAALTSEEISLNVTWIFLPVIAGLLAGCILFWFRCRRPFYYGLGEIVAALVLLVLVFTLDELSSASGRFTFFHGALEQSLGVFAAIYLIVHGLTNVEKDLPAKWRDVWDGTFHPKPHVPPGPRESEVGAAMRERN